MFGRLLIIVGALLLSVHTSSAQTPSPETTAAAKRLITEMGLTDQYRALLPAILVTLKPTLTQDRPEIEQDFELLAPKIAEAFTPFYNQMVDALAAVYATNFTAEELGAIEAFYRQPVGKKLLQKAASIQQQAVLIGQDGSRKAADDLRQRLTDALRQKGH